MQCEKGESFKKMLQKTVFNLYKSVNIFMKIMFFTINLYKAELQTLSGIH